jgi:hypothetical protein
MASANQRLELRGDRRRRVEKRSELEAYKAAIYHWTEL